MDKSARLYTMCAFVALSWIFSVLSLAGLFVKEDPILLNGEPLNPKTSTVVLFDVFAFLAITFASFVTIWYAWKTFEGVTLRKVWVSSWVCSVMSIIAFSVASTDNVEYGYGFVFAVLVFPLSFCAGFFGFISDRSLGNI